jgi:hypothetical protein
MKTARRKVTAFLRGFVLVWIACFVLVSITSAAPLEYPDPVTNPRATLMLTGDWATGRHWIITRLILTSSRDSRSST